MTGKIASGLNRAVSSWAYLKLKTFLPMQSEHQLNCKTVTAAWDGNDSNYYSFVMLQSTIKSQTNENEFTTPSHFWQTTPLHHLTATSKPQNTTLWHQQKQPPYRAPKTQDQTNLTSSYPLYSKAIQFKLTPPTSQHFNPQLKQSKPGLTYDFPYPTALITNVPCSCLPRSRRSSWSWLPVAAAWPRSAARWQTARSCRVDLCPVGLVEQTTKIWGWRCRFKQL